MNMQDFQIVKKGRVYYLTDPEHPEETYRVQKPNGKIVCSCPDFKNAPPGTCDHIEALREHAQAQGPEPDSSGRLVAGSFGQKADPDSGSGSEAPAPEAEGPELPEVEKAEKAWWLECPFRPDQVRIRKQDGMRYIDGASVIQRLNDVLGPEGWNFKLIGEPQQMADEVLVRGQLEAFFGNRWTVREDFGAHPYTRKKGSKEPHSRGDTVKAAVTDCLKRTAPPGTLSMMPVYPTNPEETLQ